MRVDWLMGGCCRPDRGGKQCPPRRAHPRLAPPRDEPAVRGLATKVGERAPANMWLVPVPWYDCMVGFSVVGQYLCPPEPDPCWMETTIILWNICSCKRIKDSTTETSHVDQLKDRAFGSARPRQRFRRPGSSQAPSSS